MSTKTDQPKRWFEADVYLDHELVGTTVYYLPVDSALQSTEKRKGSHERKMVLKPLSSGDLFAFEDDCDDLSYRCDDPFSKDGWSIVREQKAA